MNISVAFCGSLTVREIIGDVFGDEADRVLERLSRSEMIAGENADDDRPSVRLEHADIVSDIRQEVACLVRNPVAGHVTRNARAIELTAHDLQHQVRRTL